MQHTWPVFAINPFLSHQTNIKYSPNGILSGMWWFILMDQLIKSGVGQSVFTLNRVYGGWTNSQKSCEFHSCIDDQMESYQAIWHTKCLTKIHSSKSLAQAGSNYARAPTAVSEPTTAVAWDLVFWDLGEWSAWEMPARSGAMSFDKQWSLDWWYQESPMCWSYSRNKSYIWSRSQRACQIWCHIFVATKYCLGALNWYGPSEQHLFLNTSRQSNQGRCQMNTSCHFSGFFLTTSDKKL